MTWGVAASDVCARCLWMLVAGAVGCGATGSGEETMRQDQSAMTQEATAEVGGLRFTLLPLPAAAGAATRTATLVVHNPGREERRLYTPPEPFRFPMHDIALRSADGTRQGGPDTHPHGIVIGEEHFLVIRPGGEVRITAAVAVPVGGAGRYTLSWSVENQLTQWKGGAMTLDGPTRTLFGGGPIPGIWTGEVTVRVPVALR